MELKRAWTVIYPDGTRRYKTTHNLTVDKMTRAPAGTLTEDTAEPLPGIDYSEMVYAPLPRVSACFYPVAPR